MADESVLDEIIEELNVEIPLFSSDQKRKFKNFNDLKKFIDKEVEYWQPLHTDDMKFVFKSFQQIQTFLRQALETSDQQEAQALVRHVVAEASRSHSPLPYSETAVGKFLNELHARSPKSSESAYHYLTQGDFRTGFRDKDSLDGLLLAFHFSNSDAFSAKISATESSLTQLTESHQAVKDDLEQKAHKLMADITNWKKTFSHHATVWKEAFEKETAKWRDDQQNAFDKGIQLNNQHFTTFYGEKQQELDELEETFREKLRLEGPAKYWDTFADNYEKRGGKWRNWALGTAGVVVLFIIGLLATSPPWFLGPEFTAGSIRGTVLVALAVSVLIYCIRLFVKLSTSAYHLSRDARERYQLTHVFLAMVKEGAIQPEDREIILQALFSRADTGLLKTDGGPTMPTGPMGNILGSIRGPH